MTEKLSDVANRRHLPVLDGLRALSVGAVMASHTALRVPGDLGVTAFFVLSGFLITLLLVREQEATGGISLRAFYMRRVLRIFPAYYVFIIGSLLLDVLLHHPWPAGLAAAGFGYFVNYFNALNGHPSTAIAHAWSLAVEEQFYLLWPVTFIALTRGGRDRALKVLPALMIAVLAWRSIAYVGLGTGSAYAYNAFETRMDSLATGCLLALLVGRPRFDALAGRVAARAWYPVPVIAALYLLRTRLPRELHYSIGFTVYGLLIALLMVQLLQLHRSRLWSWLDNPVVRWLGRLSYPLYLYHLLGFDIGAHLPFGVAGEVGVAVLLASGSYYVVEKPFLRLKKHFEAGRRQAEVAAEPPRMRRSAVA